MKITKICPDPPTPQAWNLTLFSDWEGPLMHYQNHQVTSLNWKWQLSLESLLGLPYLLWCCFTATIKIWMWCLLSCIVFGWWLVRGDINLISRTMIQWYIKCLTQYEPQWRNEHLVLCSIHNSSIEFSPLTWTFSKITKIILVSCQHDWTIPNSQKLIRF